MHAPEELTGGKGIEAFFILRCNWEQLERRERRILKGSSTWEIWRWIQTLQLLLLIKNTLVLLKHIGPFYYLRWSNIFTQFKKLQNVLWNINITSVVFGID